LKLRILLLGTAVALSSTLAMAADLPARTAPAPLMAYVPYSWTGAYVGVHAGYGQLNTKRNDSAFGSGSSSFNSSSGGGSYAGSQHTNASGAMGGVQIGYNRQFGALVAGLEADISAASIKGSTSATGSAFSSSSGSGFGGGSTTLQASSRMNGFGTVRARLGYAADRALFYVTGGLAYAKIKNSVTFAVDTPEWSSFVTSSQSNWKAGWTLGAGMEYALTNNWSVKTEALYYDLGKKNYQASFTDSIGFVDSSGSARNTGVVARVGVNYRFW
jgi:outer membrane immunogenic protein